MHRKIDFKTESSVVGKIRKIFKHNISKNKKDKDRLNLLISYVCNEDYMFAMISEEVSKFKRTIFDLLSIKDLDEILACEKLDKKIEDIINIHSTRIIILAQNTIKNFYNKDKENGNTYLIYLDSIIKTFLEEVISVIHLYIQEKEYDVYRERLIFLFYKNVDIFYGMDFPVPLDDDRVMERILEAMVCDDNQEELKDFM
mgnify:CR=1 FL=1